MSKSHKKRDRNQSAFSGTPAKDKPETSSESSKSEPIKLKRVLLSDEFYWEVPGDVPASDRRYGMKMVPPGVPKADASSETSNLSLPTSNDKDDLDNKPVTESKIPVDTTIQEGNDTAVQAAKATSTLVKETNPAFVAATQTETDIIKRDKDVTIKSASENASKVAATILPSIDTRADLDKTDTIHHVATTPVTAEAKGESDSNTDSFQQQRIIANRKLDLKEDVPAKLQYLKEKDQRSKWRPAWIALPLLLLLGGVLYEALNNEENVITPPPVDEINSNDIVASPVIEQLPVSDETAVAKTEVGQVKQQLYYITHVVVKGDTLWDISQKYLNDPFRYPELAKSSNIKNPDLIYPGDIVTITATQPVESGVQAQVSDKTVAANVETSQLKPVRFITHVVVKGDTLWHICKKYLNNPFRYPEVAKLSEIKNPDLIYPGDIVRMQI